MNRFKGSGRISVMLMLLGVILGMVVTLKITSSRPDPDQSRLVIRHQAAPTIEQIKMLSELVTLHVPISDIQKSTVQGYTGSAEVTLIVKGDVDISSDLSKAQIVSIDHPNKQMCISLPEPRAYRPRLDHQKTQIHSMNRSGLWKVSMDNEIEQKLVTEAMKNAQQILQEVASKPELIESAKERASSVIHGLVNSMGYDLKVEWISPANQTVSVAAEKDSP